MLLIIIDPWLIIYQISIIPSEIKATKNRIQILRKLAILICLILVSLSMDSKSKIYTFSNQITKVRQTRKANKAREVLEMVFRSSHSNKNVKDFKRRDIYQRAWTQKRMIAFQELKTNNHSLKIWFLIPQGMLKFTTTIRTTHWEIMKMLTMLISILCSTTRYKSSKLSLSSSIIKCLWKSKWVILKKARELLSLPSHRITLKAKWTPNLIASLWAY